MRRVNGSDNPGEDHLKSNKGLSVPLTNRSSTIRRLFFRDQNLQTRGLVFGVPRKNRQSRARRPSHCDV